MSGIESMTTILMKRKTASESVALIKNLRATNIESGLKVFLPNDG